MTSSSSPSPEKPAFLEKFAQRVAARDQPPPPPPHGYDQASLEALIAAALPAHFRYLDPRRARTFASVCYALMQHPRLTSKALAEVTFISRLTLYRALPELVATGLLGGQKTGGRHYHFLTPTGEDWLLHVTQ